MIKKDFTIDFEKKKIAFVSKRKKIYSVNELYSFLMDLFDQPEMMKYDIPIMAKSGGEFELINGWAIDKESFKYLKGKISQL
jgi:hypothetical protein